jgi:two-component system, OmpR family, sensor kinase
VTTSHRRRRHRARTLRSRLFSWFFGAILLAVMIGGLVVGLTRPEATSGVELAAHRMSARLAMLWGDERAERAYLEEIRDVTGFDVRVEREVGRLPPQVFRVAERGGAFAPSGADRVLVPVIRGGVVVGALEMNRFGGRPAAWSSWRLGLTLAAVMAVLSVMASRVADLLARPLERLAHAADRLGGGDLRFRADVPRAPGWVAIEVRDVAVSFNRMADRVEAMVRGQRELLGAISHELRSPLGRARVALEIARDRLSGAGATEGRSSTSALDDAEAQLVAIDGILSGLLDVTRAGLADLRKETRVVSEWLRAKVAEEPVPPEVLLQVAPDAEGLAAPFDASLLARVVHNLLVNARAHGHPSDRPIEVRVTRTGTGVRVGVLDRGPGFPEGFVERAFEPFVRGDSARSRPLEGAGYGLGLAIVKRIVEAHGGQVFAHNVGGEARREDGTPPPARHAGPVPRAALGAVLGAEVGFDLPLSPHAR